MGRFHTWGDTVARRQHLDPSAGNEVDLQYLHDWGRQQDGLYHCKSCPDVYPWPLAKQGIHQPRRRIDPECSAGVSHNVTRP
jgi:hypothetical protein